VSDPIVLTDAADPRLADYRSLKDVVLRSRHEPAAGLYLAESEPVIRRALAAGHRPRSLLLAERWLEPLADLVGQVGGSGAPVFTGPREVVEAVTGFHVHRGAIAAMHRPALPEPAALLAGARRVVVLEDIVDHTNVGAIIRSCAALGADAVLVSPRCADPLYRRAVRVSMGTVFQVPWTRIEPWPGGIEELQARGFTVAALTLTPDAVPLDRLAAGAAARAGAGAAGTGSGVGPTWSGLPERLALVLGTEGAGLAAETVARCDLAVTIPMAGGVDSLNVAAAAAVALWALGTPEGRTR
jgi:tRNA G18 (ribose-2'-O)-methylase SpoU